MHRHIRTTIRLAACAPLVLLAACPPTVDACDRPAQQTLVFYDQSASSQADEPTKEVFREAVREALQAGLQCPGDAIEGFAVHAKTRGKAGHVRVRNTLPPLGDTLAMPTVVRARKVAEHTRGMKTMQDNGVAELEKLMAPQVDGRVGSQTDLVGTLEVINDEIGSDTLPVRVIYLSDMHESTAPKGRDFDRQPPASTAEAEAWADEDSTLLNEMRIDRTRMGRVHVRVLMGNLANKDQKGPEIRRYWERLFQHAGIRQVEYN